MRTKSIFSFSRVLYFSAIALVAFACNKPSHHYTYQSGGAKHQVALFEDSTFVEMVETTDSTYKLLGYWGGQTAEGDTLELTITRKDFNVLTNIATQHFLVNGNALTELDTLPAYKKIRSRTIYDKDGELKN
jgi:hypothetical protein